MVQLLHDAQPVESGITLTEVIRHVARPLAPDVAASAAAAEVAAGASAASSKGRRRRQQQQGGADKDRWPKELLRSSPWLQPRRRVRRDLVLYHRYSYERALDRLLVVEEEEEKQHPHRSLCLLRTWDEVRSKLERCLEFPPDNDGIDTNDNEASLDRNMNHHGTTTSSPSAATINSTLDAYNRRLQQESLDWVPASELVPSQRAWLALQQRCAAGAKDGDTDANDDSNGAKSTTEQVVDSLANRLREAQLAHERRRTPAALLRDAVEQEQMEAAGAKPQVLRPLTDDE